MKELTAFMKFAKTFHFLRATKTFHFEARIILSVLPSEELEEFLTFKKLLYEFQTYFLANVV